jgi:hypothetical protein
VSSTNYGGLGLARTSKQIISLRRNDLVETRKATATFHFSLPATRRRSSRFPQQVAAQCGLCVMLLTAALAFELSRESLTGTHYRYRVRERFADGELRHEVVSLPVAEAR